MKNVFFLLLFIGAVVGCKKESSDGDGGSTTNEQTLLNVSYGSHTDQKMDVYLPANRTDTGTKALILIHGGAWSEGGRDEMTEYVPGLKEGLPGYAIFNIEFRLARPPFIFPTQENDIRAAFEFIASKAGEYHFNVNKVAVLGVSSGAHLALLQAYKYPSPIKVDAVVDFFGPTDLVDMYNNPPNTLVKPHLQLITGSTPSGNAAIYQQSSPTNFVSAQTPPTIILHGEKDDIVSITQSQILRSKLEATGVEHEMLTYPNEGHGWDDPNLAHSLDRIGIFLRAHVK